MQQPFSYKSQLTSQGQRIGSYLLTRRLGNGQYGSVWKARHLSTSQTFAVKKIERAPIEASPLLKRLLQTEVSIMHEIDHPNIVHLADFLSSPQHFYLVMQFCDQGDLEHFMQEQKTRFLPEREALLFFRQIMNAFFELRKRKVLHRDFKLANIFVHQGRLLIGDFGFAKSGQETGETRLGSPLTMAPELLFANGPGLVYNSKADLWSIGVVFYQLLCGEPPFFGRNVAELKSKILANSGGKLKFTQPVSAEARDLVVRLLTFDPQKRLEWPQFFNHPFFTRSSNVRIAEVGIIPGSLAKRQALLAEKEFEENKNYQLLEKNEVFLTEEEFAALDKQMPLKSVSEQTMDNSQEDRVQSEMVVAEVFFRYSHEANKMLFMIYSVRKLQGFLKEGLFFVGAENLMAMSLAFLKKAMIFNTILTESLNSKKNVLQVFPAAFEEFLSSDKSSEIENLLQETAKSMSVHFQLLLARSKANSLKLPNFDWSNSSMTQIKSLNQMLAAEAVRFGSLNILTKIGKDADLQRKYFHIFVLVKYNINLDAFFPYFENPKSADPKMNWNAFYYALEKAGIKELKLLI